MKQFLEPRELGVYEPDDLAILSSAFGELRRRNRIDGDESQSRALARSLIKLYRHGLIDADRLIATLEKSNPC